MTFHVGSQARRQEMKWGVFLQGNEIFFLKWTFPPQNETKLMLDLFFILLFTYLGGYIRTQCTPLPTGLEACSVTL